MCEILARRRITTKQKGSLDLYIHTDAVITFVNRKECALILTLGELQLGPMQTRESIMNKDCALKTGRSPIGMFLRPAENHSGVTSAPEQRKERNSDEARLRTDRQFINSHQRGKPGKTYREPAPAPSADRQLPEYLEIVEVEEKPIS